MRHLCHRRARKGPQRGRRPRASPGRALAPADGDLIGGFPEAQGLRVAAIEQDVPVELALPAGAKPGYYSEHAADWVLPLILGVPTSVVSSLIATYLQRRLDTWRSGGGERPPTARYREAIIDSPSGPVHIREIEGPPEAVLEWLSQERGSTAELEEGDDRR